MPSKFFLSRSMQSRDLLGAKNKIPRLSTGSTRKLKTRRSQSSFSSVSDVLLTTERLKFKLILQWAERMKEARRTSMAIKGEVFRPDRRARRLWTPSRKGSNRWSDPSTTITRTWKSQARTLNGRKLKERRMPRSVPRSNREKKCCSEECSNQRLRVTSEEKNNHL